MRLSNRLQIGCVSTTRRGGQVLLVAVLLMLAILLIGILFVALVTYNQSQSARHEDQVVAQGLAEAAVRFADEQLPVIAVGAQITIIVFDDDKVAVSFESTTAVDHCSIGGRTHRVAVTVGSNGYIVGANLR